MGASLSSLGSLNGAGLAIDDALGVDHLVVLESWRIARICAWRAAAYTLVTL